MKKIAVKVCSKVIVASISQDFFDEINIFMNEKHYNSKAELARASIRKLLNGSKICEFMDNHFYGSKAELLREALRNFIKPEVQIVSTQNSIPIESKSKGAGDKSWKKIQEKQEYEEKWNRLAIIPCESKNKDGIDNVNFAYHPYRGKAFAIGIYSQNAKVQSEMQSHPLYLKMKNLRVEA